MSAVAEIFRSDAAVYDRKAADYAPGGDPWENFNFAAAFASRVCEGLAPDDLRRATVVLIGIKLSRLMTLGLVGPAKNEAITDTLKDLRVYAAILEAQHDEFACDHLGVHTPITEALELELDEAFERLAGERN